MRTHINGGLSWTTRQKVLAVFGLDEKTFVESGLDAELTKTVQWLSEHENTNAELNVGTNIGNQLPRWGLAVALCLEDMSRQQK